jgi:hypothetical protein
MTRGEVVVGFQDEGAEGIRIPEWLVRLWLPVLIAGAVVTVVLLLVVAASKSAWLLLGAGRGFVPEAYFHLSAFVLMLGTTFGQAVGWAGGSAVLYYVMTIAGFGLTWSTARLAMSLVYLGLGGLHVFVYHLAYGQWLLRMPRAGIEGWLAANYPDARWLLITAHDPVDWSLVPLAVVFLGVLWGCGERPRQSLALQTVLALALMGTSLAIALSLGIHSTLAHIRL